MAYVSESNLSQFWGLSKEYINKKNELYANWHRTETARAVTCCPVPESELHPVVSFSFTETPPEEGDKSPSNPSTISGVSSVSAGRAGKNLLVQTAGLSDWGGLIVTANADGSYTFNGSYTYSTYSARAFTDSSSSFGVNPQKSSIRLDPNKTYTLSAELVSGSVTLSDSDGPKPSVVYGYAGSANGSLLVYLPLTAGKNSGTSLAKVNAGGEFIARVQQSQPAVFTNAVYRFQLEEGDTATDFEVPMRSADLRFFNLNGTYYGGSIDLKTGLMTVTQIGYELDSSLTWYATSANYVYRTIKEKAKTITSQNYGAIIPLFKSSHYTITASDAASMPLNSFYARADGIIIINTGNFSLQDFKDWLDAQKLAGTPVVVAYPLAVPQTVQLTPQQIKALPALNKYEPRLNTLFTDADSIQVSYQKSPIQTELELTDAILALGGGE